jgi:hypothetical protein
VRIRAGDREEDADAAIVAVGPHQLARALAPAVATMPAVADALAIVARYGYESITTIYLGYRGGSVCVCLRDWCASTMRRVNGSLRATTSCGTPPATRRRSIGCSPVVISTSGPHDTLSHEDLAQTCDAQLRRLLPALPALAWSQAIAERRATYACVPGLAHPGVRPRAAPLSRGRLCLPALSRDARSRGAQRRAAAAALDHDARSGR